MKILRGFVLEIIAIGGKAAALFNKAVSGRRMEKNPTLHVAIIRCCSPAMVLDRAGISDFISFPQVSELMTYTIYFRSVRSAQ